MKKTPLLVLLFIFIVYNSPLNAKFVSFFGEFNTGGIWANLTDQNNEVENFNQQFKANGWNGAFNKNEALGGFGVNLGVIFDMDIFGNMCFYSRFESMMCASGRGTLVTDTVEKVYYPTGELAAENEVFLTFFYASAGIRKYWLDPWGKNIFNIFTGVDIGRVFGGDDMLNIRRVVYDTSGNIIEDKSRKRTGGFTGICVETGFIIPSNFGIGFVMRGGYLFSRGMIGHNAEMLDLSGYYIRLGVAIDFIENYKNNNEKKLAFDNNRQLY